MTLLAIDNTLIRVADVQAAYPIPIEESSEYKTRLWFRSGNAMQLHTEFTDFVNAFSMAVAPDLPEHIRKEAMAMFSEGLPAVILGAD